MPSPPDDGFARAVSARLVRPAVLIAVGNDLRGDDAFGPEVARLVAAGGPLPGVELLDGGVAPENLAERAARTSPRTVLLLDAVRFTGPVGELRLIEPGGLEWGSVGTHAPSLGLLAEYVERRCGARVLLLGCEPGRTDLGEELSPEVRAAAARAADAIRHAAGAPDAASP